MGEDKHVNEDLIKYGLPEDIWFHVDDMSSAHVYLRLKKDQKLEDVDEDDIHECAQLVKANSIEGCKASSVKVIYTRWRNLNKTSQMEVGAIGFHDRKKIKSIRVEKDNKIVNAINKTKEVLFPDLADLQQERAKLFRQELKAEKIKKAEEEKEERKKREDLARLQTYSDVMVDSNMKSNIDIKASADDSSAREYEDDFF